MNRRKKLRNKEMFEWYVYVKLQVERGPPAWGMKAFSFSICRIGEALSFEKSTPCP